MAARSSVSVQRWRSLDYILDFSSVKPKLENILSELERICEDTSRRKESVAENAEEAAVAEGGSVLGRIFDSVRRAFILIVTTAVSALEAVVRFLFNIKITDEYILQKVKRLMEEFCDLVQPLKDVQPEKRDMSETLDKEVEDPFVHVQSLIDGMSALYVDFESNSTLGRLLLVTEMCGNILIELEGMNEMEWLKKLKKERLEELKKERLEELKKERLEELKELKKERLEELKERDGLILNKIEELERLKETEMEILKDLGRLRLIKLVRPSLKEPDKMKLKEAEELKLKERKELRLKAERLEELMRT